MLAKLTHVCRYSTEGDVKLDVTIVAVRESKQMLDRLEELYVPFAVVIHTCSDPLASVAAAASRPAPSTPAMCALRKLRVAMIDFAQRIHSLTSLMSDCWPASAMHNIYHVRKYNT